MKSPEKILISIILCNMLLSSCGLIGKSDKKNIESSNSGNSIGQQPAQIFELVPTITKYGNDINQLTSTPREYVKSIVPLPTKEPTLTISQEEKLQNWISVNHGCALPCILGIVVNETTIQEALGIISENYPKSSLIYHPYYREETDDFAYVGTIDFLSGEGDFTEYYLRLIVKDDIVNKIESTIEVKNLSTSKVYPFYSLENTLTVLGVPDKMYIIPAGRPTQSPDTYSIFLYYMDEAIEYEIFSFSLEKINNEYTICPDNGSPEKHKIILRIYSDEADLISEINRYIKYDQDVANGFYMPFEDVTGISIGDFYNSVINIDNYCFTIKSDI